MQIKSSAKREMLKRFLAQVPLPPGKEANFYGQHLDALIKAGYDEPDDVADLEEDEATLIGIPAEHLKGLVNYAEEYETRELLHIILVTHTDHKERGFTLRSLFGGRWSSVGEGRVGLSQTSGSGLRCGLALEDLQRLQ